MPTNDPGKILISKKINTTYITPMFSPSTSYKTPTEIPTRNRAYLFSSRQTAPLGRIEAITWNNAALSSAIWTQKTGNIIMQTTTTKNHNRIKVGQVFALVTNDDIWYEVVVVGMTSRGGSVPVQSSECAGTIQFITRSESKQRPWKYNRAVFPIETVPKFKNAEEAEAWLDAQAL